MIFGLADTYFDTMKRKSKYQRKYQKSRDCTKCKRYGGFISKNYFICLTEFEDYPECRDIYDRDVLKKGTCSLFVPMEIDQDDSVHDNNAMDRDVKEIVKDLFGQE